MIAIMSDFGYTEFLGQMKARMLSENPKAQLVDLCNTIPPQSVREGAWVLYSSYKHFPKKTIFLCVVDPGVGSDRKCIAVKTKNYFFVGPDNGVMYAAMSDDGISSAVELDVSKASHTFHGRDVFAPAAAKLEKTKRLPGKKTNVSVPMKIFQENRKGEIVRIDIFGNIITNVPPADKGVYEFIMGKQKTALPVFKTYDAGPFGKPFLVIGSAGTLEISVRGGRASDLFKCKPGDRVELR